ncbi:F-box protein SKIP16 [Syzygium oleosum]|uniref:F-box protein SKIP16 n=1 Tax=Syzygium oleosum TaxID=219896 RepID=UPI0011D26D13|nr:F-box protein SKIP16 [Syzygium oleosum]
MELESVGDLALHVILTKLGPEDVGRVACVNRKLRLSAAEDTLWSRFCSQELDLSAPLDPHGDPLPSFKAAYQKWRDAFCMYPWPLVRRVKRCWDGLQGWLLTNFPEAAATLRKGASEADIQELESVLRVKLPLPTRILYRFHDGQDFADSDFTSSTLGGSLGIIGGYSFYNHLVNVNLLPLKLVILETNHIIRHLGFSSRSNYVVVAASCTSGEKLFFLNCIDGQLHVGTRNLPIDGEMMPCVPNALISSVHDRNADLQQDAMLLWLEEHGRRLQSGMIKLREGGGIRSICQFPEEPPLCSTAITNGVRIRSSAVFVPEFADLQNESEKYFFSYSIRMSLVPEGCMSNGLPYDFCQLNWRHWIIRANDAVVSDVNGEAVIGKFPLLHSGGKEFVYESCTSLGSPRGSIEGTFTFVPGRLADPKGGPFSVQVAQFPVELPDYVF